MTNGTTYGAPIHVEGNTPERERTRMRLSRQAARAHARIDAARFPALHAASAAKLAALGVTVQREGA